MTDATDTELTSTADAKTENYELAPLDNDSHELSEENYELAPRDNDYDLPYADYELIPEERLG